ncbi:MAG: FISUMP domain-containing protein [Bacteroidia bacterium]
MKNLYTTFFLSIFGMVASLSAQTLKNIHRHNLPVLRIPIDLIDKVETFDVEGQKYLHVTQFNGFVNEVPVTQIDSITHTYGTALDPSQLGNLRMASVMGVVRGQTGAPEMNAIVRSPYGGEQTETDQNGVFFLNNILVYDKLGYITITKPGFHQGSRSFLPLETGSNQVNVQLLPMTQSGTFSAASGGTVTSGLLQLTFPANAIIRSNGQPYTGTVRVYAAALDPTSPAMFDQMPGELLGGLNDSLRLLRSFSMASVELRDANMNELALAIGVSATLRFNIPTALQAEAPETIDWWSFDETLGYWKHEGEAQKQGTKYIGLASHFSWWNCDVPQNFNDIYGTVNSVGGTPISDAQINVVTPTMGTGITYTNSDGVFTGRVPKNQLLTLNIKLTCSSTSDWALAHSEILNSQTQALTSSISASLSGRYPITGTLVNCQNQPVAKGYVKMGPQVFIAKESGQFTIQTCAVGEYVIRGFDTSIADSIKASAFDTVQVVLQGVDAGILQACLDIFGTVTDIDGNTYPTVLIGNQWWMAENLRTSTYANGEPIDNVTDNTAWGGLSTGAWCHYGNNTANDTIYGKLYNWYTTVDPSGLCPAGWHVPTDAEWTVLTDYLGGLSVAGVKMKTATGWNDYLGQNGNGTNSSGFSALPGGFLYAYDGLFYSVGYYGRWWSSSESSPTSAWKRYLLHFDSSALRGDYGKRSGLSVRCVKD